jgi:ADP-ribose pyrophosphatase YjhB (NUDIX family)
MTRGSHFFSAVAARNTVRPRVAGIVVADRHLLVQRPNDDPTACYAFIGGEYEVGDTLESRLRAEFEEETTASVVNARYLFVLENRFRYAGRLVHGLEHYFLAEIDRVDVRSRESHLEFHWLALQNLREFDLRPHVVRDAILSGSYLQARHLVTPYSEGGQEGSS